MQNRKNQKVSCKLITEALILQIALQKVSFYQILIKYLKNVHIKDYIPFSIKNNIIFNLQFRSRQYFTSYALISITENIRKALDDRNTGRGVFVDLQKAFDTVNHQILLAKLNHYGIHGYSYNGFKFYLSKRNQYVSINGYDFGFAAINCGILQRSILGPLIFLLFTNDLDQVLKFCKFHHFADDTNLLWVNLSKNWSIQFNADLKHLVNWFNANKISPNLKKTEILLSKCKESYVVKDYTLLKY